MSRSVTLNVDGTSISMITDQTQEHIERVTTLVDEAIDLMRRKNRTLSAINLYRFVMVYFADQIVDLQDLVSSDRHAPSSEDEVLRLKKELQSLKQLQANWEGRVSQLQELLLEKNQQIQELKE